MDIPPIAPFPPASLRKDIPPAEWTASLEAWSYILELHLRIPLKDFKRASSDDGSLTLFLSSYLREVSHAATEDKCLASPRARQLRRDVFLVAHRLLSEIHPLPASIASWNFLLNLCRVYARSRSLRKLLADVWKSDAGQIESVLQKFKGLLIKLLDSPTPDSQEDTLAGLAALMHASPDAGAFFMTGSDLLDSLAAAYQQSSRSLQPKLVIVTYLGLMSLVDGDTANHSLLFDNLYSLKAETEKRVGKNAEQKDSLLSDIVTNTPILRKLEGRITGADTSRARTLATSLLPFRHASNPGHKKPFRRKIDKGKTPSTAPHADIHVHRLSQITQIQDLFPPLGSAFIVKLLDAYDSNIEAITAALLDDALPPSLQSADRSENLPSFPDTSDLSHPAHHLTPRPTPPLSPQLLAPSPSAPQRHKHDDEVDAFDNLTLDPSRLHIGRRAPDQTADSLLNDRTHHGANKAAILAALSAFDADDDERDDTYDEADVGATVDTATTGTSDPLEADDAREVARGRGRGRGPGQGAADEEDSEKSKNEEALYRAWKSTPEIFSRAAEIRRSPARRKLKEETGTSDEVIEGWAIMLAKDGGKMLRRLETRYDLLGAGAGPSRSNRQRELASTAWRGSGPSASATEDEDTDADAAAGSGLDGGARGRFRGRGRGSGASGGGRSGGRGGNAAAGSSDDKTTQVARHRKEANKSSRANHNRRDQRARKMARGGFAG